MPSACTSCSAPEACRVPTILIGCSVIADVQAGAQRITLPQFDKARDDRSGQRHVACDVLVLEGWCWGNGSDDRALTEPINDPEREADADGRWRRWVNTQIEARYTPLWTAVDFWLQLQPPGFAQVVQWRRQQESQLVEAMRMDEQRLRHFIEHYERLTRWQWAAFLCRSSRACTSPSMRTTALRGSNLYPTAGRCDVPARAP